MGYVYDGILGLAIGDALGVPVEFLSRSEINQNPVTNFRAYGTHNQPAGTWSDDTSLTLALLDSLAKCGRADYRDIMDHFSLWRLYGDYTAHGEVFDIGNATNQAIWNYDKGRPPLECGGRAESDNGNGSLMRILPAAFYLTALYGRGDDRISEQMELIHNLSSLTHGHPRSQIACGIYCMIAKTLIHRPQGLRQAVQNVIQTAESYYTNEACFAHETAAYSRLNAICSPASLPETVIYSTGYVVHTLEAAVWCLLTTSSYRGCVLKAVNLGDDTDTTGAVAGGLAGIYYGLNNIPKDWRNNISAKNEIERICSDFELQYGI